MSVRIMCGRISLSAVFVRSGQESVHVNVDHIAKGTLFPFGGCISAEPASVSTWIRIEDSDRDGCPL